MKRFDGVGGPGGCLEFSVLGKVASNNRTTRNFAGGAVKSAEARGYQGRVFQHAFVAVQAAGWETPEACSVEIVAYNCRLDVDNIAKNVLDGMIGAVYDDDRRVTEIRVKKLTDVDGQRIVVRVDRRSALEKPRRLRKKAA